MDTEGFFCLFFVSGDEVSAPDRWYALISMNFTQEIFQLSEPFKLFKLKQENMNLKALKSLCLESRNYLTILIIKTLKPNAWSIITATTTSLLYFPLINKQKIKKKTTAKQN